MNPDHCVQFDAATAADIELLVPLFSESSGGVLPAIWDDLAEPGESLIESASRYLRNSHNQLSLKNTALAKLNGSCMGAMASYQEFIEENPKAQFSAANNLSNDLVNALKPYGELTDPDSWFIAEICVLSNARGRGLGTQLLEYARSVAIEKRLPRLSLRVFSENEKAIKLYRQFGFDIKDSRAVAPHTGIRMKGHVHLMTCPC